METVTADNLDEVAAEAAAEAHHDEYERVATLMGYETRKGTRVPWADLPPMMRQLMIDSERHAIRRYLFVTGLTQEVERLRSLLQAVLDTDGQAGFSSAWCESARAALTPSVEGEE